MFPGRGSLFEDPFFRDPALDVFGDSWLSDSMFGGRRRAQLEGPAARSLQTSVGREPRSLDSRSQRSLQPQRRSFFDDPLDILQPWGFFGSNMADQLAKLESNPNAHVYRQSAVSMYSSHGDEGKPLSYQAMSSSHQAPGQVRETRQAMRSSKSGLEKMSIGHHLGDRSHVIGQTYDHRTKQRKSWQNLDNLDESDAAAFNEEWETRTRPFNSKHHRLTGHVSGSKEESYPGMPRREPAFHNDHYHSGHDGAHVQLALLSPDDTTDQKRPSQRHGSRSRPRAPTPGQLSRRPDLEEPDCEGLQASGYAAPRHTKKEKKKDRGSSVSSKKKTSRLEWEEESPRRYY